MHSPDPDALIDACEAVRDRLPSARFAPDSRVLDDLSSVTDDYDVFLFDAFGVLNIGETAISGAVARVAALRGAGRRVMVVSNASSVPKPLLWQKYRKLGFDFSGDEIVSSRDTLLAALHAQPVCRWGVMAPPDADLSDLPGDVVRLLDADDAYDSADGFILLAAAGWTDDRQARLVEAMRREPRPVLVANPDLVAPREHGFSIEPGTYARRLETATGAQLAYFGKPFGDIFGVALQRLGGECDPRRVLMVGDTLHTDILGGRAAGFNTALILDHGVSRDLDLDRAIARTGIRPDIVARTV